MPDVMAPTDLYLANFRALKSGLADSEPDWLGRLREEAFQAFSEMGFPAARDEEWKYTSVAPIVQTAFQPAFEQKASQSRPRAASLEPWRSLSEICLVFVNGSYCEPLSSLQGLPSAAKAGSLARWLREESNGAVEHLARYADHRAHPFVGLNTALWHDGAYLWFPKGTVLEKPVQLLFVSTAAGAPVASHPRCLILAERETQLTIVQTYLGVGQGTCFSNSVTEIVAGENAVIDHYNLQFENELSSHIATLQVYQDRGANFTSCSVSFGGALVRNEVNAVLDAEGAECTLNGIYLAQGRQHMDNRTSLDHAKPHCSSRQVYNGVLDGHATGVFNGRIIVRPDAQKTDAIQKNRNLLLSEAAVVNTKPQLEIFANDVRCTHGATVGQIDPEALFYLRSRGIAQEEARNLLVYAFAGDILDRIRVADIRTRVEDVLHARLAFGLSAGRKEVR
ncbi:MAG: Fe-S cluster assembly protein SufD [Acidobacteria bacterium]|nr:Fe-S cluster assembly protein SufD [Acidobacteriota bacterium]